MNLEQLRSFRAVASEGGFSRAAEALFLTQSTISMQVGALEKELGVRLFDRLGRRVTLTSAGKEFLHYAIRILTLIEESRRTMAAHRGLEAGELAVGASFTIGSYLVPALFGAFRQRHAGVRLILDIAPTHRVVERVVAGDLDLGLVEGPAGGVDVKVVPFRSDELLLIVAPGHRWTARSHIAAEELADEPFLEREPGSGTREIVQGRLAEQGIRVNPVLEMGSPEALKQAVRAGLGVAIVSRATVEVELEVGLLATVPVHGLKLTRPFQVVIHKYKYLSPPLAAFLDLVHGRWPERPPETGGDGE